MNKEMVEATSEFKSQYIARCEAAAAAGSHIGIRELLAWAWDLAKSLVVNLDRIEVKGVILEAYDKYVAPYDLPYIPNLLEPSVDRAIRAAIEAGIDKIFDALAV